MPNAVITTQSFAGDGTQLSLINAINSAMLTAGFSLLDSYTNVGLSRVWNYDTGGGFTYSNLILEFGFTNTTTATSFRGYDSFNTGTDTGSNPSTVNASTFGLSSSYTFDICSHPEVRGVFVSIDGVMRSFLGYLRPDPTLLANNWWNQNSAPYAYIPRTLNFDFSASNSLQTISSLRPGSVSATGINLLQMTVSTGNSNNSGIRLLYPASIVNNSAENLHLFSTDVVQAPASGMMIGDFNPVGSSRYTFFNGNNKTNAKLLIKTA